MVAFVLPPRGQVAPADGPMSMFRRYSQGEEDEVKREKELKLIIIKLFQSDKTNGLCRINPVTKTGQRLYMVGTLDLLDIFPSQVHIHIFLSLLWIV